MVIRSRGVGMFGAVMILTTSGCYPAPSTDLTCVTSSGATWEHATDEFSCEQFKAADELTQGLLKTLQLQSAGEVRVEVAPYAQGGAWAPTDVQEQAGYRKIFAETECATADVPTRIRVASDDWSANSLCHEMVHAARQCQGFDHVYDSKGACISGFFCEKQVDKACASTMASMKPLSGATGE